MERPLKLHFFDSVIADRFLRLAESLGITLSVHKNPDNSFNIETNPISQEQRSNLVKKWKEQA